MGSEHYCLRWNNHQSNLLGVFSQLLQDESLVDVTLACSEGAPIRAHKVVLSACSSYFQSLFLDHPERHPIVILKDVRFAELQTLVEFMYKGEVNVQYCQLQALLKTAESLKVKGLAEMTNQNSSLREPEREPDRLRPHSQPNKSISCDSPVDAALTAGTGPSTSTAIIATPPPPLSTPLTTTSGATSSTPTGNTRSATPQAAVPVSNAASAAHKRDTSERGSPLPTKRLQTAPEQDTPLALDLFQRRAVTATESEECSNRSETNAHNSSNSSSSNQNQHLQNRSNTPGGASGTSSNLHNNSDDHELLHSPNERPASCIAGIPKIEDVDDYDEAMDLDEDDDNSSNEVGLNMKIGTGGCVSGRASTTVVIPSPLGGGAAGGDPESARSTPAATLASERSAMPSDLTQRPASRSSRDGGASGSGVHRRASTERERPSSIGVCGLPTTSGSGGGVGAAGSLGCSSMSPTSSTAAMGVGNESLASGGGLGPVQSVPLSLKKEIDCSEDDNSSSRHMQPRSASASGVLGGELDYRTAHESLLRNFGSPLGNAAVLGNAARCPTPFAFPFTPLGLSLFDIDPSRLLSMLHHQAWFTEEALRNRNLLASSKEFSHRFNPLSDLFSKDYYQQARLHSTSATDLLSAGTNNATATSSTISPGKQHSHQAQSLRSNSNKQQQQQQPFNIRYPSPTAAFFQHHQPQHQQQQQQQTQKLKTSRQGTPSPLQTATSTQSATSRDSLVEELKRKSEANAEREEEDAVIELSSQDETTSGRDTGNSGSATSSMLYKDSLEQLMHRRRSSSSLGIGESIRSYSQLLLSNPPSCTDTSSFKEKSSSSSTSSTPPPTSAMLAHHQQLNQMLKSPSESSLFSEPIEEETRCVVCNAHFPNVWLLEQHAALQHPHIGPGEEKPFICEQCGQSYRYRSAYAKHKEQNHRARLPADKLFTCDVCGMQFRYLKSFKKHRLNHALERLHGKKGVSGGRNLMPNMEQDVVTSSQEVLADESGEDLRINIKREQQDTEEREEEQDSTIDSAGLMLYNDNNSSSASASTNATDANISSTDVIHSTNKRPRLLATPHHIETDPSYHHLQQQQQQQQHHHHHQHQQQLAQQTPQLATHLHSTVAPPMLQHPSAAASAAVAATATAMTSLNSLNSITSLINADRIPSEQFLGLNPQEASILNFLRVDAAERQRDKRPQTSRFACPFCGKCVRSKENLKLHVRKHTGERPFVCLFCGRAFGGKSDLTRHLRIHTGERPYHCESCGKCFARADYLSKHLTTHIHNAPR